MKCSNCGFLVEKGWRHCPNCGIRIGGSFSRDDIFSQVFKQMEEMTKDMGIHVEKDMEVIDLSQMLNEVMKNMEGPQRKGFSIRVQQRNNEPPKIKFEKIGGQTEKRSFLPKLRRPIEGKNMGHKIGIKLPGETEEPKTDIKRSGNKVFVEIKLPGVKGQGDIDINELENSIEVKAVAGNRGYFKIIKKPEFSKITKKSFDNQTLKIELL